MAETRPPVTARLRTALDALRGIRQPEAAKRRTALLEAAMDGSGDGFWAWELHASPTMWYSPGAQEILGRRAEELDGSLEQARSWLHPDDLPGWLETFRGDFDPALPYYELEVRLYRGDGALRRVRVRATAERDARGTLVLLAGSLRDVTPQREAEDALEASRRMVQTILDAIPVRVFWKDRANDYLGCNQSFADDAGVGIPAAISGKTDFELAWPEHAELYRADDQQVMQSGVAKLSYEEPQARPDGTTAWLRTSKVPLLDADGNVAGVLGCYEDITAQKQLEEELRQAQKLEAVGQLAGGIAHDFNNVLTVILGNAGVLKASLADSGRLSDEQAGDFDAIRDAAERASGITHKLLAFSRREVVAPQVITLEKVLSDLEPMLRSLVGDSIDLSIEPSSESVHVLMDPRQLEQVVLNLVINARDAMPGGGHVSISTSSATLDDEAMDEHVSSLSGLHARLDVKDDGEGIDPADLERVFEPFFTTKRIGEGTGLGLSTVHGIVTGSGGHVRVVSSPGRGTHFSVLLPAATETAEEHDVLPVTAKPLAGNETILLCEDDVAIRRLSRHMLESKGYEVLEAPSARHAVSLASTWQGRIHLVLTDVIMPELNGRQVAEQVTADRPDCRVLYVSGYTSDVIADRGVPLEGASLLEKPFTQTQLLTRVREVLDA